MVSSRAVRPLPSVQLALLLAILLPAPGAAQPLTRKDRLAVLYSNQVVFDRRGEPLVSVRLTEAQDEVTVQSDGRLTLLPGGDDAARVTARRGARWTFTVEDGQPGRVRAWVVAERLPAAQIEAVAAARARWTATGLEVRLFEAGALLGLAGKTLDTRTVTVGVDPQPDAAAARARAAALRAAGHGVTDEVIAEALSRPTGWIVAREAKSKVQVRARDLLWITPDDDAEVEITDLEWGHGTPKRGRADRRYRGDVYLAVGNDGRLVVANLLPAERLLEGVVPSEIFPSAPAAALRAQAVAARGQLLAKVGTRHRADPYLLCAETHCQVYTGATKAHPRTTAAVRATRGELLFDAEGLVDTTYSSACGGHSEAFHPMWGGAPKAAHPGVWDQPAGGVEPITDVAAFVDHPPPNAWCAASAGKAGVFRWTRRRTAQQVAAGLAPHGGVGRVLRIEAAQRGVSGRAVAVTYVGETGRLTVEGSYVNRTLLGRLPSGAWVATPEGPAERPTAWTFRGGGFGHGVGMCQHGAIGQARAGRSHADILTHYYRGSHLERGW